MVCWPYVDWIVRNIRYHGTRHPGELGELEECLTLRLKDLDFVRREIRLRRGKGGKDRVTMLPEIARAGLEAHLERVRALHARDLSDGAGSVELPTALVRKAPGWAVDLAWQ